MVLIFYKQDIGPELLGMKVRVYYNCFYLKYNGLLEAFMEFKELAKERYSVRSYKDTKLTKEQIDRLLEVSNLAPTGKNNQPHRIYVLQSEEALEKINELTQCAFHAPVVFMFTYNLDEDWKNFREEGIRSGIEDVSIVACHVMFEAQEMGLGTCWVNAYPNTAVEQAFNIPDDEKSVLLMPIGYPADDSVPSERHELKKSLDKIVRYL